eukprot:TRINITY_DN27985_c0_g1_i1.p1 TRINITY_DN27985_c0_g1~~TRINITY_DN27985_c0_g1_i1.p1  ORF type:complete len:2002 (+),score=397.11 TRINITY_DN27985_c0_g1_i1:758-6007(+)
MEGAHSEVFFQCLHIFSQEGPACELDAVHLLAPESEFAKRFQSKEAKHSLLLTLFVQSTGRLLVVRLWSWEVVAALDGLRACAPLLPGDDLRARRACPSGLAGLPSCWLGADHCRMVLQEMGGPPLPSTDGLPQPWADELLDPLELTRASAVLCYDRHRLPQYLLLLSEASRELSLLWGGAQICQVEILDARMGAGAIAGRIDRLGDAVANRFTVHCEDGSAHRCAMPLQPHSPRLSGAMTALALLSPSKRLAELLMSDIQVWCVHRGSGRSPSSDEDDEEWRRFCELLFCLVEQALADGGSDSSAPPYKRARKAARSVQSQESQKDAAESPDWEWLLGSAVHARERHDPRLGGLTSSQDFLPHSPLRQFTETGRDRGPLHASALESEVSRSTSSDSPADVWDGQTATQSKLLLQHLDDVFLILHLMYEEWKMHSLSARLLPQLALLLFGLATRLRLPRFAAFYAQDYPAVRDPAVAMAAFGGYGAWLWQIFKNEGEMTQASPAVQRMREADVPHLLLACRQQKTSGRAAAYPEVFPLSSLLLSLFRLLAGPKAEAAGTQKRQAALAVPQIPRVPPQLIEPPAPLPPFSAGAALAGAERARSVRRWLQSRPGPGECATWEAALMLLVQHQVARADVELWSMALSVPVQECLRAAAEEPRSDWLVEAYTLIGREDLALMAQSTEGPAGEGAGAGGSTSSRRTKDMLEAAAGLPGAEEDLMVAPSPTADPIESPEWLYRMFDRDQRAKEVARLLNSSKPVTLRMVRRPEQSDHDFEQAKQSRLAQAAVRQAAVCVGRGAFTLGAIRPLPTELLQTPMLVLSGRFPPQGGVQSLDPVHHKPELNVWAEFSNGAATALQVSNGPGAEITRGWILHHKSEAAAVLNGHGQAASNGQAGQALTNAHAGFILGLGLRGCLKVLPVADCYKYLRLQHDTLSAAVIMGMAASHIASMDAGLTRMCCVHIPSMLPATFSDMEVASPVQCSAVLSLGLLFAGSGHRMMTELLVAEIGRRPSDRALHDREGYSLAAGFALGCICLGQGAEAPGLADLQLHTWLLRYIHGGSEMPMPGAATREAKQNPNQESGSCTSLLSEPEGINISITSPAGCIALALIFLRTNCESVSSRIVIPQNVFQLDYIRPDFAMLRLLARNLIMWDSVEASEEWLQRQIPSFLSQLELIGEEQDKAVADIDWLLVGQTKASLIAGACLALGLRFAGTSNQAAKQVLVARLTAFRDARRSDAHPALMASRPTPGMDLDRCTLETCQSTTALALGMVMAGTGDLTALRSLRSLRKKAALETSYGVHMATHMAIGWVCLGGGGYTFDQEPLSIAALLMAAFPRLPTSLTDNRCHLQAFRHLYVLAARHRCVEAVEVDTKQPVDVHVSLETSQGSETASFPRLMLSSGDVRSITLRSERYWPVSICRAPAGTDPAAGRWMKALEVSRRLYVKRRSGHLPYRLDGLGAQGAFQASFPKFTAPELHHIERLLQVKTNASGSQAARLGGLMLPWLQQAGADGGLGPLEPGTLVVSAAEWAAALCCAAQSPLPQGSCELDFVEDEGSLAECFAALLLQSAGPRSANPSAPLKSQQPVAVHLAQKLYECIIESKLDCASHAPVTRSPASCACSAMAVDQLLSVERFYQEVRDGIGARHRPLLSEDFLAERCQQLKRSFEKGSLSERLGPALAGERPDVERKPADSVLAATFLRLHGLSGHDLEDILLGNDSLLKRLPQLRRKLPGASVEGLRRLLGALQLQRG